MPHHIQWKTVQPAHELTDFVESFWMLENPTDTEHQIVLLPDGRFDIIFSLSNRDNFRATLKGLDTEPEQTTIPPHTCIFAVSFKLLAIEYVLEEKVDTLLNEGIALAANFWDVTRDDLSDFKVFCKKVSAKISSLIKPDIDNRKKHLFELIYTSNGTLSVKELSEQIHWSSRQINRYFHQTFGISLKSYCTIFRFKSSLQDIKNGNLFPELNFTDQTHFIKKVKKMSGVTPKQLSKNENDRFILLSSLPEQ